MPVSFSFSQEQLNAIKLILAQLNVFLLGAAGTGKTIVLDAVVERLRALGRKVICCAPTGLAADHIGGITFHHLLGIRNTLVTTDPKTGTFHLVSPSLENLKKADVLIIDEVSMLSRPMVEILWNALDELKKQGHCIQLVMAGDFYQLSPVIPSKLSEELAKYYGHPIGKGYAFESEAWDRFQFEYCLLTVPMRQSQSDFYAILDRLRHGDKSVLGLLKQRTAPSEFPDAPWICGHSEKADQLNREYLAKLPGTAVCIPSVIRGEFKDPEKCAPAVLELKEGMEVIMTANDPQKRFFNGSRGTISSIDNNAEVIRIHFPGSHGRIALRKKIWTQPSPDGGGPPAELIQFPVLPAYAITIHKAQGLTFDKLNVEPDCWDFGQLYTACSRVRTAEGLYLNRCPPPSSLVSSPAVKAFYSEHFGLEEEAEHLFDSIDHVEIKEIPSKGYRRGARFGVYNYPMEFGTVRTYRAFIVLRAQDGCIVGITDLHRLIPAMSSVRAITSTLTSKLYYITSFLNYLFIDVCMIDSLEEMTVEMVRDYLAAYGKGAYGKETHTKETILECVSYIRRFLVGLTACPGLDLMFTLEDLIVSKPYFSRNDRLFYRDEWAFPIIYDPCEHSLIRDIPLKALQVLASHICNSHPEILINMALCLCAALRPSESCSLRKNDLVVLKAGNAVTSVTIDLSQERPLRSDAAKIGGIKKHRICTMNPMFHGLFSVLYARWEKYQASTAPKCSDPGYAPLCLDQNGHAMTYKTFYRHFKRAVREIIPVLRKDPDPRIRQYAGLLDEESIAPHIFRHAATLYMALAGCKSAEIMAARGDSSPFSAMSYLQNKSLLSSHQSMEICRMTDALLEATDLRRNARKGERS
jgi:hypothetical protein